MPDLDNRIELVKQISKLIGSFTNEEKQLILDDLVKTTKKGMPISLFKAKLSCLEIVTRYLKDNENRTIKEIAKLLNRKPSTLYTTYTKSKKKFKPKLDISDKSILIPFNIFSNRKYSMLESLVAYLKDTERLSLKKIASVLNRKYNTIKTVYRRFKLKR